MLLLGVDANCFGHLVFWLHANKITDLIYRLGAALYIITYNNFMQIGEGQPNLFYSFVDLWQSSLLFYQIC